MIVTLLTTNTFSDASSSVYTSSIDGTYDEYMFVVSAVHSDSQGGNFNINFSIDGGSNYNVVKTTTIFQAYQQEDDSGTSAVGYQASHDLAQSANQQRLCPDTGDDPDQSVSGIVHLFSPSSTTYVKHFYATMNHAGGDVATSAHYSANSYCAGYCNTTSAINAVQFQDNAGNFDGVIQMYGIA